jgi:hypothetical protein
MEDYDRLKWDRESAFLRWTLTHLGPWPGAGEIQVACASILVVCFLLTSLSAGYGFRGLSFLGHEPGGDFLAWFVVGKILDEHPHRQLYDIRLQNRLQHDILPTFDRDLVLVYANAPWLAVLFQPLARLPYIWAYILWLFISAALFIGGMALIWPRGPPFDEMRVSALLISASFFPFAFECWFGGQLSIIGFCALALCIRCQQIDRLFASGAALALCTYKPTLLLLILPMLVLGRRFRTLLGFLVALLALGWISFLAIGLAGLAGYVQTLMLYGRIVASSGSAQRLFKYVDLNTFLRILYGGPAPVAKASFIILGGTAFACLAGAWIRSTPRHRDSNDLLWSMTIASTLVINVYVPIYDSTLILLSAVLIAGPLYRNRQDTPADKSIRRRFHVSLMALYAVAFITQYMVPLIRVQLITLNLAALGAMAFRLWATTSGEPQCEVK